MAASEEIEERRIALQVSKEEMVRRVSAWDDQFSGAQYWRIRNGKAQWTLDRFVFVAEALGMDPPMLLDRILRGHNIMELLREEDGPEDAGRAAPAPPGPDDG